MNRIKRKSQRNAIDDLAIQTVPLASPSPRYEVRPLGDRFVPFDTLTKHVPMGYTQGFDSLPACQRAIETSLALNF